LPQISILRANKQNDVVLVACTIYSALDGTEFTLPMGMHGDPARTSMIPAISAMPVGYTEGKKDTFFQMAAGIRTSSHEKFV
jgi:hypothetical protein